MEDLMLKCTAFVKVHQNYRNDSKMREDDPYKQLNGTWYLNFCVDIKNRTVRVRDSLGKREKS